MDTDRPPTAEELDSEQLKKIRHDSTRILAFTALVLTVALIVVVTLGVIFGVNAYGGLQSEQQRVQQAEAKTARIDSIDTKSQASLCDFFFVVATVQVSADGPHKSIPVLVRWIVDSRNTYAARGCTPPLPPPSSDLRHLSTEYHLVLQSLGFGKILVKS